MRGEVNMAPGRSSGSLRGFVVPVAFGATVSMWAIAYFGRLPAVMAPSWLIAVALLCALLVWAIWAGRRAKSRQ